MLKTTFFIRLNIKLLQIITKKFQMSINSHDTIGNIETLLVLFGGIGFMTFPLVTLVIS